MQTATANEIGRPHLDAAIAELPDPDTVDDLIARYVRPGGRSEGRHRARVSADGASVPVWALIGHLRGGDGIEQTANGYALPEEAVVAAVGFYAKHRPYIDAWLLINEDDLDDWDSPDDRSA